MALGIVYIIPASTDADGKMRHFRWLTVKIFCVNADDYHLEPSSRSVCPWTWITTWKCSRMDWSEQLYKCEEIAFTRSVPRRKPRDWMTAGSKAQDRDFSHSETDRFTYIMAAA